MAIVLDNQYWQKFNVKEIRRPPFKQPLFLLKNFFNLEPEWLPERVNKVEFLDIMYESARYTKEGAEPENTQPFSRGVGIIEIPRLTLAFNLDASMLKQRVVGEGKTGPVTAEVLNMRKRYYLTKAATVLKEDLFLALEKQAAELLQTGKIKIEEYANGKLSRESEAVFGTDIAVTANNKWDSPTTDIIAEIEKYGTEITLQNRGNPPNTLILGHKAYLEFRKHPLINEMLKTDKGIKYGDIKFSDIKHRQGAIYVGKLAFGLAGDLEIVCYNGNTQENYDKTGNPTDIIQLIDPKKIILCNTNMGTRYYTDVHKVDNNGDYYSVNGYEDLSFSFDIEARTSKVAVESNSLIAPMTNDTWRCVEVLA